MRTTRISKEIKRRMEKNRITSKILSPKLIIVNNNLVKTFSLLLVFTILFSSCGKEQNIFYQKFETIENSTWNMKDVKSFEFEVLDTNTLYDFYFNLRSGKDYQFENIHIFYKLISPDGRKMSAKTEFVLAQPDGKWLGKSISGTLIENSMKFNRKKKFPVLGKYTFEFIHGMRPKDLENISDVGLKIKKSNEQK